GVFTGEYVGEDYVFNPDAAVTRGEFLTMCMTAAGCDLLRGVSSTGFGDDADIDAWLKPYVATALLKGYVEGVETSTGANFYPDEDITLRDACLMLNSVLGVTDVVSAAAYVGEDNAHTTWAQAVANLTACSVMLSDWDDIDQVLTRAGAAELLANAIGLLSGR
ncbi:MAG: S-layer homology domain-containing protein, partial [Oscillospiraceae bacterium]|nr:S-layer homology domain-containing protein [Oscillospiraceae bacterium]